MIWCLGMYGSASTWTFNLVQQVAAAMVPDKPVLASFAAEADMVPTAEAAADRTVIVKTHAAPAYRALAERATTIVVSIRDPRDAVASLLAHNQPPFDVALHVTEATAGMCGHFSADPRAVALRFEDRFFDDPATLIRVAARFPGTLPGPDAARIWAGLRRDAVESFIARLDEVPTAETVFDQVTGHWDTFDPVTGWHKHHAGRSAEVGRWRRELTAAQALAVEQRLAAWMTRFGYPPAMSQGQGYTLRIGEYGVDPPSQAGLRGNAAASN